VVAHFRIAVGHCGAAVDFVAGMREGELEGKLHVLFIGCGLIKVVDFFAVLRGFVL
jgi:hypothetical protein